MTRTVRDRLINLALVIVSGVAVSLFTSFQANKHSEKKDYANEIQDLRENKADKAELNALRIETAQKINESESRVINHMDSRFDDIKQMIELLHKQESRK